MLSDIIIYQHTLRDTRYLKYSTERTTPTKKTNKQTLAECPDQFHSIEKDLLIGKEAEDASIVSFCKANRETETRHWVSLIYSPFV